MKPVIAISIPTGIGADIGGYAGDFGYIARKFSRSFYTIINPNAVNGGILSAINYDMGYLEGYLFDEFFKGTISITPKKPYEQNKIGVIFDCDIKKEILNIHLNTLSALEVVQGAQITGVEYTQMPVGIELEIQNNISAGTLKNPDTILNAAEKLIRKGAQAIAVVCNFNEDSEDIDYSNARGIDPIGGIEAVISHLITREFKIPSAHAPAFSEIDISTKIEHKKVASEMISSTYLPCVIQGLSIAPEIKDYNQGEIKNKDVNCLIVPYSATGCPAVLSCVKNNIEVVFVKNKTVLDVTGKKLNIDGRVFGDYEICLAKKEDEIIHQYCM